MRRTKEDAEKTRLKIIEAALVLFSRNGFSNTTLAMIGTEAGYSRGPIYWHFKNKDDLYQAVLACSQEPLEQLIDNAARETASPVAAIDTFARQWLVLLAEDVWFRQSFEILLNKTELTEAVAPTLKRERELTRHIVDTLSQLVAQAQQLQQIPATQPADKLGLLVYTYLMGVTQSWLFAPELFCLKQEEEFFVQRLHGMLMLN
ncbi:MAG: TetR family transcriptional regulator [Pseudomonas sp.]|jgi:AcrR family transcriptional regulator|uniref:TetR family transcriptional regulator n=1 Tax=Halopseudomonas TaxID=2901189 RepID=UPI001B77100A|nr:TetR family transcriptional regulator [Pseudomonas sp.]MBQ0778082.1 TetR family transcriptional regulator [Pseudomonas sp.]WOD10935.1 TetR family transcriptional regulator [Pseudomonas sp. NyZ704]